MEASDPPRRHSLALEPDAFERQRVLASLLPAQWPVPARVRAFTTLRGPAGASLAPLDRFNFGSRSGEDPAVTQENRRALAMHSELPSRPCWLHQVHGTRAVRLDREREGDSEPEADAAVTSTPGVVLAILTADCLPVLLCGESGDEIGAAHAGWRGLAAGVLENTVAAMKTDPGRLVAWLGPAAGPGAYEVGEDVRAAFVDHDNASSEAFIAIRPGHWLCDLCTLARRRLAQAGVTRVHGGGLCTISDPQRFYSHRRDGRTGRMASLVCIDPATS